MKKYLLILSTLCIVGGCAPALAADGPIRPSMQQISNTFFNLAGTKAMTGNIDMGGHNVTNSPGFSNMSGGLNQTQAYAHSNQPIKLSFFGTHFAHPRFSNDTTQTPYFANTAGSVRTWDTFGEHLTWKEIETANGVYNWTNLDAYVTWAQANGMEITFTLGQPPDWAVVGGADDKPGTDYNSNTPDPAHPEYWGNFCTALATRYKGKIASYEIWNEPPSYYLGTAAQLAALTQEASTAIKAVDPAAKIISASCTGTFSINWLDSYFSALQSIGALSALDIVGYHFYIFPNPPESMIDLAQQVRAAMFKYGIGTLPLWDTETTWAGYIDPATGGTINHAWNDPTTVMPSKQGAGYITRMFLSGAAAGCDKVFMYGMDQNWSAIQPVSLSHPSNLTQTGKALQQLVSWAVGKRIVSYVHDKINGIFTLTAKDSSGNPSSWIWTEDNKPQTVKLNTSKGMGRFANWSGVTSFGMMSSVSVPINYAPKLFTGYNPQYAGDDFSYTPPYSPVTTAAPFDNLPALSVPGGVTYISAGTTPIIGAEIIPDPYFATPWDWTCAGGLGGSAGWTVSGGVATVSHTGGTTGLTTNPGIFTVPGQEYQVTITISAAANTTDAYVQIYNASGSQQLTGHASPGTYTETFVATRAGQFMINVWAPANPSLSVTYFSVKPVNFSAVSLAQSSGFVYDPIVKTLTAQWVNTGWGANVASASTITPTGQTFHVTGTTTINAINVPTVASGLWGGSIHIIPDGVFSTGTSGNIATAVTSVVNAPLNAVYDNGTGKWYIK